MLDLTFWIMAAVTVVCLIWVVVREGRLSQTIADAESDAAVYRADAAYLRREFRQAYVRGPRGQFVRAQLRPPPPPRPTFGDFAS